MPVRPRKPCLRQDLHPLPRQIGGCVPFQIEPGKSWRNFLASIFHSSLHSLQIVRTSRWAMHAFHRAGHQERLDAHVDQPREVRWGVVGVQRAEYQVARQRRLNGSFGRFHDRAFRRSGSRPGRAARMLRRRAAKVRPILACALNLADAGLLIFDGIFDRDDLGRLVLDLVEGGIERRRFAGTGRAGHQNDAVRPVDQLLERLVNIRRACRRWRG